MADGFSLNQLFILLKEYGPFAVLLYMWWHDTRRFNELQSKHEKRVADILTQHEKYMRESRQMYENNVLLVENYERHNNDMKDLIVMNTEIITKLTADIEQNQYCPMLQRKKQKVQVVR